MARRANRFGHGIFGMLGRLEWRYRQILILQGRVRERISFN